MAVSDIYKRTEPIASRRKLDRFHWEEFGFGVALATTVDLRPSVGMNFLRG